MSTTASLSSDSTLPAWLAIVRQKVESLAFGVVHDGQVTQIERTEKTRLPGQRNAAD